MSSDVLSSVFMEIQDQWPGGRTPPAAAPRADGPFTGSTTGHIGARARARALARRGRADGAGLPGPAQHSGRGTALLLPQIIALGGGRRRGCFSVAVGVLLNLLELITDPAQS